MATLAALLSLCGCGLIGAKEAKVTPSNLSGQVGTTNTLNNALDLLHDLLGDEKNLSKVLLIKHASPALKQLVKNISAKAGDGLKVLESFQKTGDAPAWGHLGLPPGERATREAISKTKEHELLHSSGSEFEFQLLLSQSEALNYGTHLAQIAAQNDSNPAHASKLLVLSRDLAQLHSEVLARLRTRNGNG
jgi:hypothetical protein